jgi:hypothetical protein
LRTWVQLAPVLLAVACGSQRVVAIVPPPPSAADGGIGSSCLASPVLTQLAAGQKLLVGADMTDSVAELAPFSMRYLYLAGGLPDGSGPCARCGSSCSAGDWWGCWQDASVAPGQYLRDLILKTSASGQLPLVSYYELLQTSKVAEGSPEVAALADASLMARYFADWRFTLQQIGNARALLHVEPDLWGYAEQVSGNPHEIVAAVAKANPTDCAVQENSAAGFGRCLIAMVRKYAPNARIGLHASSWATGVDVHENTNPAFDVAAEGRKLADFLVACGAADADFVVFEASDRDAGYYKSIGKNTFWDATNATLPSFHQAFAWSAAITGRVGKPALWWQVPLGNMSLPNVATRWQDNRVDYFFSHPDELARANAFAMVFGAGRNDQTNPSTDSGNFVKRVQQLAAAGGQAVCP